MMASYVRGICFEDQRVSIAARLVQGESTPRTYSLLRFPIGFQQGKIASLQEPLSVGAS